MKPRHLTVVLFVFSSLFISRLGVFAAAEQVSKKQKIILALGDSLTEGYGIEKSNAYPAIVEAKLQSAGYNVKVVNAGISGSTSASAPSRLRWLLKSQPDYLFLVLGANDGLRGVDLKATENNLRTTIQLAKKANVQVWLAGMKMPPNYGRDYTKKFEQMFSQLAKSEKVPFLPFLLDNVAGRPELNQPDGIHPNEKGHALMAEQVFRFMKELL